MAIDYDIFSTVILSFLLIQEGQLFVLDEIQLVAVKSVDRGLSVKPGLGHLGHLQTVQTQIRHCRTQHLIRVCTVCLNYRELRVK